MVAAAFPADIKPAQPSERQHLAFLDSIRALAALWVVLSHIWISQFGMLTHPGLLGALSNWAVYSHLAVDIFIVLSGFCLIIPVNRAGHLYGGSIDFFARRARRILPPFYAALLFSLIVYLLLQFWNRQPLALPAHAVLVNAGLMQDIFLNQDVFNGPFWSIAVEWRIYFLFPLLAWSLMRRGAMASLAWTAIVGYALTYAVFRWQSSAIMSCPWYLLLFAMGACAGAAAFSQKSFASLSSRCANGLTVGVLLLAALLYKYPITPSSGVNFGLHMPIIDTVMGVCTAAALILITRCETPLASKAAYALSLRPLTSLGPFAYSLYLVHLPCILLLSRLLQTWQLTSLEKVALLVLVGLPCIISFAYLFFLACERPFVRSRPKARFALKIANISAKAKFREQTSEG